MKDDKLLKNDIISIFLVFVCVPNNSSLSKNCNILLVHEVILYSTILYFQNRWNNLNAVVCIMISHVFNSVMDPSMPPVKN